ncbi:MAG: recombination-associated protein RdgC [Proteobacteria bacterium]|nr:recombination-associated protein RdgC [Pseudomonadota bacterium]
MAILSGALTVRRFRVLGDVPDGFRDSYRDRLNEYGFKEPAVETGKEATEGWCQTQSLLDVEFDDFDRWLHMPYATFALRVDKKTLPAKLLTATVKKKCEAWCAERGVERCPASVKSEIKDALEAEWLKRTLPRVAVTECVWSIQDEYLLLHSLSEGTTERFRKRFFQTFGLKLIPWSPLDWTDGAVADRLVSSAPSAVQEAE